MPRSEKEEADALTNMDFRHLSEARRVKVDLQKLEFGILPELLQAGEQYLKNLEDLKAKEKLRASAGIPDAKHATSKNGPPPSRRPDLGSLAAKRKKSDSLKEKHPW